MYELLVVDDEPLIREYMRKNVPLLNKEWVVAGEAMDGLEALDLMESRPFDLVITDIRMPEMDGLELAARIREKYGNRAVAIVSGYDDFSYAKEALRSGVREYLLKPLVKNELSALLEKTALQLEEEKRTATAYQVLKALSDESVKQVAKNFLKALLADSNVEIKALYPLVHMLKIDLMETTGVILAFELDEDILLIQGIKPGDIPIYRFILNRIALEVLEVDKNCTVFFDEMENTKVFITGESAEDILKKCMGSYHAISAQMLKHTGISATAAAGYPVEDILQLKSSSDRASALLLKRLESGESRLYFCKEDFHRAASDEIPETSEKESPVNTAVASVRRALLENNEAACHIGAEKYAALLNAPDLYSVYRYGVYLIKSINGAKAGYPDEQSEMALKILSGLTALASAEDLAQEIIVSAYHKMLCSYIRYAGQDSTINKKEIVTLAMEYIYDHFPEPISLALVAEKAGVSSCYLSDVFRKNTGESYIKFLTRIRMEQAARLLKAVPPPRIADIAEMVGYISVKHFSYIFKQYFSMTPGEYMNNTGKHGTGAIF